jgi:signal transduction histidine kinase
VSALLAAQVTGDLYQITEWALDNYKRERRAAIDLFENRQQLERALQRSRILGEKLQNINTELENAKHFRGQFLANMSHELRTPLNAINGFSETMLNFPMMYDDVVLPDAYRHDLEQINHSGQQLLTVINDILDLSKVDAGKLEVNIDCVELDPLIDSVLMTAAGLIANQNKPVDLKRDMPRKLPDVYADDARLRQVLLNLYSNAVKFTDVGSITMAVHDEGETVRISVSDTGEGIPEDTLEEIFNEFSQAESAGRDPRAGAGLGLTISRRLLNLMSGRIWAESVYGEGATFHVVVPKYNPNIHSQK